MMTRSKPQDEEQSPPIVEPTSIVEPTMVNDYSGQGGSYILDSTTGQRTLVHQTLPATTN